MISPPNASKEQDKKRTAFSEWQKLFFPHKSLMYHGRIASKSTHDQLMSHVNLRRRSIENTMHHLQKHNSESNKEEFNESDPTQNELLIAEFKLMNQQMRLEIRSLYRLLLLFIAIVVGISAGGILFCGNFFRNINDFHHAVFNPSKVRNSEWTMWHKNVSFTFYNIKNSVDWLNQKYVEFSGIVDESFNNHKHTKQHQQIESNAMQLSLSYNGSSSKQPIKEINEILQELRDCDQCIFQFDDASSDSLFRALKLIKAESSQRQNEYFTLPEIFGVDIYESIHSFCGNFNLLKSLIVNPLRQWWKGNKKNDYKSTQIWFTQLLLNITQVITANTRCKSAKQWQEEIAMVAAYLKDIPLGKVFEKKNIQQIIEAKSVITFKYKHLMCGDSKSILDFYQTKLRKMNDLSYRLIIVDLNNKQPNANGIIEIPMKQHFIPNERVIIAISLRIGILEQYELRYNDRIVDNAQRYNELGLFFPYNGMNYANAHYDLRWRQAGQSKNEQIEFKFVIQSYETLNVKRYDESNKHMMLDAIKQVSIDQYSQELMYRISTEIGGVIMKVLQVLAIREDVITSPILRKAFKEASDNNPNKQNLSKVHALLRTEYGPTKYAEFISRYDLNESFKAGSVGQIHFAHSLTASSEESVIIKVTFPESEEKWKKQWSFYKLFGESNAMPLIRNCWKTIASLDEQLFGEMNFEKESRYTRLAYQAMNGDQAQNEIKSAMKKIGFEVSSSYVPCSCVNAIDEWSGKHVMMQQKAPGKNLKDWLDDVPRPSFEEVSKVFKSLIIAWARLTFKRGLGIIHSDPHYGNVMVQTGESGNVERIYLIDWGQTDLFLENDVEDMAIESRYEWFMTFKKLMRKIYAIYDAEERQFGDNAMDLFERLKADLIEREGLYKLIEKSFLESFDPKTMFERIFLEDLKSVMVDLKFESETNSVKLLAGLAMGALNNDPRFSGADKTHEAVMMDPLKTFPPQAALVFRAITGLVGMLHNQETYYGKSLTDNKTLVEMFEPFLH